MLGKDHPLAAAAEVIAGYHAAHPLEEAEIAVLFPLIAMRLAVSVVNSALRKTAVPDDPYIPISEAPGWAGLEKLAAIHPRFAHYSFRSKCGLTPVPGSAGIVQWLTLHASKMGSVLGPDSDPRTQPVKVFDLSVGSTFLGADPANAESATLATAIFAELKKAAASIGVCTHKHPRTIN